MTVADKKYQTYMVKLAQYCRDECFFGEYYQSIRFKDKDRTDDDGSMFGTTLLDIDIDEVYLQMLINVYPAMRGYYDSGDFKGCGKSMLHEICHVFIKPVTNLWDWDDSASQRSEHTNIIERQTQRICNALHASFPKGWYLPSKINPLKSSAERLW